MQKMIFKFLDKPYANLILLTIVWIITVILTDPLHDFPLNDDWAFSLTVKHLVEDGKYMPQEWLAIPFLTQALWGSLFCLPFGFSFSALTLSTLVLGLSGILVTYLIIAEVSGNRFLALLAGLLIATNPIYTNLSVGFMSDVHFYAFFTLSIYFYLLYYKTKKISSLISGAVFGVFATFIRQYGLAVPLGFMLFEIIYRKKIFHRNVLIHIFTIVLIGFALIIYDRWLDTTDQTPTQYWSIDKITSIGMSINDIAWRIFTRIGSILLELGLWLFPFILAGFISSISLIRKNIKLLSIVLVILLFPLIRLIGTIPAGNTVFDFGLGPITTSDYFIKGFNRHDFSIFWILNIIRPISLAGGIMLVLLAGIKANSLFQILFKEKKPNWDIQFGAAITAILIFLLCLVITIINSYYFDRYNIPLFILMIIIVLPLDLIRFKPPKWFYSVALVFLIGQFMFGIAANRFYLEWNRVRWRAARELINQGVPAKKIDGGFEFNFWHGEDVNKEKGFWNPDNYDYIISFNELDGYQTIKRYPVSGSLSGKTYEILVLEKP